MKMRNRLLLFTLLFSMVSSSCVPTRRLAYVQSDRDLPPSQMVFIGEPVDDLIRPGDEIYVRISSADEQPTALTSDTRGGTQDPSLQAILLMMTGL
jgi:hypothetical protein